MSDPAFITHNNYIKRLSSHLEGCAASVSDFGSRIQLHSKVGSFIKLFNITDRSVKQDIDSAVTQPDFAAIAAPWLPVKCYYALYYVESILIYLIDGSAVGFDKGGHKRVRRRLAQLILEGKLTYSNPELNKVMTLEQAFALPAITPGSNTSSSFWCNPQCDGAMIKKITEYALSDAKTSGSWDLRTLKGRNKKKDFCRREIVHMLDTFYWYRIKANYRDMDYVDYENGVAATEVLSYMKDYFSAYSRYRDAVVNLIKSSNLVNF